LLISEDTLLENIKNRWIGAFVLFAAFSIPIICVSLEIYQYQTKDLTSGNYYDMQLAMAIIVVPAVMVLFSLIFSTPSAIVLSLVCRYSMATPIAK
jgi:uncharacterized membrane protein